MEEGQRDTKVPWTAFKDGERGSEAKKCRNSRGWKMQRNGFSPIASRKQHGLDNIFILAH